MKILWLALAVLLTLAGTTALAAYVCFRMVFYIPDRKKSDIGVFTVPRGEIYKPYQKTMEAWAAETAAMPHQDVEIRSFDGLTLRGKYYEYAPGAPIELMIHGYRGTPERDMCGGVQRCAKLGRSALLVEQRATGGSGGNITTFGIHESLDCQSWVQYMIDAFGPDVKIILTGISMGAATVLTASARGLPDNVIGILADCGYTSARDIIQKVLRQIHLPPKLVYPFIRLAARLYGRFDLEEISPVQAMKTCKIPVIFFHGETDDFVPCSMSEENYHACTARKKLVTIPGAGHGMSYLVAPEAYLDALAEFFETPILA